ncbi:hypothetical protein E2C01_086799 [Portunus trituberculatus]|uniref:Uncharacterized protein n=1 Tax=Portunus trituberculatus TaxID=210409 RepID=A0A5B7J6C4_PORTR|nr:hypothetical protein [Portunus trituberculatus]
MENKAVLKRRILVSHGHLVPKHPAPQPHVAPTPTTSHPKPSAFIDRAHQSNPRRSSTKTPFINQSEAEVT